MDDTGDIERYLSKKDPSLGRVIKIVRAARGELLRPLPSTDNPFPALVRAGIYQRSPDAVRRRIARIGHGLKGQPTVQFVKERIERWRPYRSIATMYLYQAGKLKVTTADIHRGRASIDEGGTRSGT